MFVCICFAPSQAAWSPNPNPVWVRFCQGNQHSGNSQLGVENRTKHTASLLLAALKIPTGVFKMLPGKPSPGNSVLWTRQCFFPEGSEFTGMFSPEKQSPSTSPPLCALWARWLSAAPRWRLFWGKSREHAPDRSPRGGSEAHTLIQGHAQRPPSSRAVTLPEDGFSEEPQLAVLRAKRKVCLRSCSHQDAGSFLLSFSPSASFFLCLSKFCCQHALLSTIRHTKNNSFLRERCCCRRWVSAKQRRKAWDSFRGTAACRLQFRENCLISMRDAG